MSIRLGLCFLACACASLTTASFSAEEYKTKPGDTIQKIGASLGGHRFIELTELNENAWLRDVESQDAPLPAGNTIIFPSLDDVSSAMNRLEELAEGVRSCGCELCLPYETNGEYVEVAPLKLWQSVSHGAVFRLAKEWRESHPVIRLSVGRFSFPMLALVEPTVSVPARIEVTDDEFPFGRRKRKK